MKTHQQYLDLAEEIRTIATLASSPSARETLLNVSKTYEQLAEVAKWNAEHDPRKVIILHPPESTPSTSAVGQQTGQASGRAIAESLPREEAS